MVRARIEYFTHKTVSKITAEVNLKGAYEISHPILYSLSLSSPSQQLTYFNINTEFRLLSPLDDPFGLDFSINSENKITLNVGGQIFITTKTTLLHDRESMLAALISGFEEES